MIGAQRSYFLGDVLTRRRVLVRGTLVDVTLVEFGRAFAPGQKPVQRNNTTFFTVVRSPFTYNNNAREKSVTTKMTRDL